MTSPHSDTSPFSLWAILPYKQEGERRTKTWEVTGRPPSHGQVQVPRPQQCRGWTHNLVHARVCVCVCVYACTTKRCWPEGHLQWGCPEATSATHSSPRERPDPHRDSHLFSLPMRPSASSQWRSHVARREHPAPHSRVLCHLCPGTRPASTRLDPPVWSGLVQGHQQGTQCTHSGHSEERPSAQ